MHKNAAMFAQQAFYINRIKVGPDYYLCCKMCSHILRHWLKSLKHASQPFPIMASLNKAAVLSIKINNLHKKSWKMTPR